MLKLVSRAHLKKMSLLDFLSLKEKNGMLNAFSWGQIPHWSRRSVKFMYWLLLAREKASVSFYFWFRQNLRGLGGHSHWPPQEHLLFIPHGPHICLPLLFVIPVWPGGHPGIIDSKGNLTRLDTRNSAGHMICVTRDSPVTLSEPQFLSLHGEISIPTWTATGYSTGGLPWEHPQY